MRLAVWMFALILTVSAWARPSGPMRFEATANAVSGVTAKGTVTHEGVVAADPTILPLGSRIRITGAGAYSGVYVVTDTGSKVTGRHIDIHMTNAAEAKRFGKKMVTLRVLRYGNNEKDGHEVTPKTASR